MAVMPTETLKKVAEKEAAEANVEAPKAAAKPAAKKTTTKPAAKAAEAKVEAPAAFAWPKPVDQIMLTYLTERVSAEVDVKNPGRPFISADGKLHVKLDDWREWLVTQGLAPSRNEAAIPLRAVGEGRTVKLPGVDKGVGFYVGDAPKGTAKLPRRPQATATRQPRNPFAGLSDEQREVVKAALSKYSAGTSVPAVKQNGVRDELLAQLS
jgi:hypothetical protein